MVNIFISHAEKDTQISNELNTRILEVFDLHNSYIFDSSGDGLSVSDDILETILKALHETQIVIVIITPNSINRPWVNFEIGVANGAKKIIMPCLLNISSNELKLPLNSNVLVTDLKIPDHIEKLLKTIRIKLALIAPDSIIDKFCAPFIEVALSSDTSPQPVTQEHDIEDFRDGYISIIKESISLPSYRYPEPHTRYLKHYEYGKTLGQLNALEDEMFQFTEAIECSDYQFKAMKFLITKKLFNSFSPNAIRISYPDEETYYPFCIPANDTGLNIWWDQHAKSVIEKLEDDYNRNFRLPTYDEWLLLATRKEGWDYDDFLECNLTMTPSEDRTLCAVNVFPNGKSDVGCFDVIGNAWELCLEEKTDSYPTYIVGWSYQRDNYQNQPTWWRTKVSRKEISFKMPISFRLIYVTQ